MVVVCQLHVSATKSPGERTSGTHRVRGWVGARSRLDVAKKKNNLYPCWELNLNSSVVQPIAQSLY
jgi:hypothetical protein